MGSKALEGQKVEAKRPSRMLLVSWDGAEVQTVSQDSFLADNADDAFVCAAVLGLKTGGSGVALGGGASPMVIITALDADWSAVRR